MKHSTVYLFIVVNLLAVSGYSQNKFSVEDLLTIIREEHPVQRQIQLYEQKRDAYLIKAKGAFDPKFNAFYDQKSYDGKNYYQNVYGELKIPTRIGPELKIAYEHNVGEFLNNKENLPNAGLFQGGIMLPLGNGLLFDDQRYNFQEGQIQSDIVGFKQIEALNKTIYTGIKQFINWSISVEKYHFYLDFLSIAKQRFGNIRSSFQVGDLPAVDTLEVLSNVLTRSQDSAKAFLEIQQAFQNMKNFSWIDGNPVPFPVDALDASPLDPFVWQDDVTTLKQSSEKFFQFNPTLNYLEFEQRQVGIDLKLTKEYLKPTVNLRFNPLVELNGQEGISYQFNDYKFGFDFSLPILNRKYRGEKSILEVSLDQIAIDRQLENVEIQNQVEQYFITYLNLQQQYALHLRNITNLNALVLVEREKFNIGESSIFLINSRENKLLAARLKLLDLKKQMIKTKLDILFYGMSLQNLI